MSVRKFHNMRKEKFKKPEKIDLSEIPLEKIIGYKPPDLSEEEIAKYKDKIEYLEYMGIVGIFDGDETPQEEADKWQASYLIELGEPLPKDLVDRLLSYKKQAR